MSSEPVDEKQARHSLEEDAAELYETAPCGYLSTTPEGRIVKVNRTLAEWIGCEREELLSGKRFTDLLTAGGRIFYETHLALLLRMHGVVNEIALDIVCGDGRVIPALVSAVRKSDSAGTPQLYRITVFNATERRRYEGELLAARQRADQSAAELSRVNAELARSNTALLSANEELGQFAYAASHDLQEPLRTMTAYAQLLSRRYGSVIDGEGKEFIELIVEGSGRMQLLIGDLLAFSQAQASHLVLRPTEMGQTVAVAMANLGSAIRESNAVITQDRLPLVTMDAARIAQVFQNLIGNAIKYKKPEERPRIHISAASVSSDGWSVAVEDNGMGFDPRFSEQIFGIFKRLHGREIPGTGIGLAICRKIVEAHGGRIWAASTPGSGSRFSFTMPE